MKEYIVLAHKPRGNDPEADWMIFTGKDALKSASQKATAWVKQYHYVQLREISNKLIMETK